MKTQIFNKSFNIPLSIDSEQFISIGAAVDMYTLLNAKLRSIDTITLGVFDLQSAKYSDMPRVFLIDINATGKQSFQGGTTNDFGDSTGLPYSFYDASSGAFVGFYNLDASGVLTYLSGGDLVVDSSEYIAMPICDLPISLINGCVKARAALTAITNKGITNVVNVTSVDDTANRNIGVGVNANQYTTDLLRFKVVQLEAKYWKRLQFPFHTAFNGTWYNVGQGVSLQYPLNSSTQYVLVFFEDVYGNVSFPFIYVVNP